MSSALVRQALEFVDQEEGAYGRKKQKAARPAIGQDHRHLYKRKSKKPKVVEKSAEQIAEENVKKLLALSQPATNTDITKKIVERAIKRKPLADSVEVETDDGKSILFPNESYKDFENELFCS